MIPLPVPVTDLAEPVVKPLCRRSPDGLFTRSGRSCRLSKPLPVALWLSLCAALAAVPVRGDGGFPWTLEWKRLTGFPAGPVAWADTLVFLAEA
ncbi:MAG: hypothetical protein OXH50_11940, partial [Gemmatimonadetes bacterium]|nr:hypothetical protein [Gemmatimonadota bacterium]